MAGVYTPILAFIFSWRRKKISNLRLGRRLLIVYLQDNDNLLSKIVVFLPEDMIIEPYNETLEEKSARERRAWGDTVLNDLRKVSDLEHDEFGVSILV